MQNMLLAETLELTLATKIASQKDQDQGSLQTLNGIAVSLLNVCTQL